MSMLAGNLVKSSVRGEVADPRLFTYRVLAAELRVRFLISTERSFCPRVT